MSGLLKKLWEKAESAGYRSMASRGLLVCPFCGTKLADFSPGPVDVITCPSCGGRASAAEWTASSHVAREEEPDPDLPPPGTRITRSGDKYGEWVWNIPASGKSGGLMFFGIVWSTITALLSGGFLMAFLSGKEIEGNMPEWALIPFFGIFWAIGLGMLYAACRSKYARHRISAGFGRVVLRRELFGRSTEKSLDSAGITSVSREVFYQQNYKPVFGIQIKGARGKLRFGSALTDEEKTWLVADLKRVLIGKVPEPASTGFAPTVPGPVAAPLARQSYFSLPVPKARGSLVPMALMLVAIGSLFVFLGTRIGGDFPENPANAGDPLPIRIFVGLLDLAISGFQGIWMLSSAIMLFVGILMLARHWKARGQEMLLEGTDAEISIRTFKYSRVIGERTFPRSSVTDIRCSDSGSLNGKTMKRVELIVGDKAEKLAGWIDADLADAFVTGARSALG